MQNYIKFFTGGFFMKNKMIYALFLVSLLLSGCGSANQLSSSYEDGIYYRPNKEKQSARLAAQEELDRLHYSKYNRNVTDTLYFDEDGVVNINYKPGEQYLIYEDGISYEERIRKFEDPDYTINITFDTWDYAWYNPWWGTYRYHPYYGYNSWLYGWGNPWYVGGYYGWYDPWYYDWHWGFGGYFGWYDPWYHNHWWHCGFYPHYPGYHPHPGGPGHKPDWGVNNNNFIYGKRGEEASYRRVNSTGGRRDVAVSGSTSTNRRTESRDGYSTTSYRRGSANGNSGVRTTTSTSRRGNYSTTGTSRNNSTTVRSSSGSSVKSSGTSTSRSRSNSSYSRGSSSNSSRSSYSTGSSSSRSSYSGSSSSSRGSYSGSSSSSSSSRSSGGSGGRR